MESIQQRQSPKLIQFWAENFKDITGDVNIGQQWTCRSCMSLAGNNPDFQPMLPAGSYIELEFEGSVDFVGIPSATFKD